MSPAIRHVRDFIVSLRLTVVLLVLGMILVFAGTLAQVELGIWTVQEQFFRSFIAIWKIGPLYIPLPGGYAVGGLLLINLLAAHIYRFKRGWKKFGIELTHIGLILLLVGELLSGLWQEDYSMRLVQGETKNYSESYHDNELAITDTTDAAFDEVVAIPEHFLARGETVQHPKLPFRIVPKKHYPNSGLRMRGPMVDNATTIGDTALVTTGSGLQLVASPAPMTYKQNERNWPTAFVELVGAQGSLGTWLVSQAPLDSEGHQLSPQKIEHGGRTYTIALRSTRAYKPFALTLLKFSHDRFAGTDLPKFFSSRIRLNTPNGVDDREVLIYMNNPLRYAGLTFYQASFEPGRDDVTVLQVVRNPSWLIPYIACSLMTLGLTWQFCIHLFAFIGKRRAPRPSLA